MGPLDCARAIDAALSIASSLGLPADRATVVHNSNKLALRLLPCDVFARVSGPGAEHARFEIALARALATTGSPVAALEPRVDSRGYARDGFDVSLWTFYEPQPISITPADYSEALERLHADMRSVDVRTPHFTDRAASAEQTVADRDLTPGLDNSDREMLAATLRRLRRSIGESGAPEQLIHGEPHPGNVISTVSGPLFIDLETCCRGPVEFDLAHVPEAVSGRYPGVDAELLGDCRQLVLAMVAVWRWEATDQFPSGPSFGEELLDVLRAGPPWPTLDEVVARIDPR